MSGVNPEPYTGAFFTLRYDECKSRITGWGFSNALSQVYGTGKMLTATDYPYWDAVKDDVVAQAELAYMYRELSAETPDQWTYLASVKFSEIVRKYEPVLKMEADVDVTSADIDSQKITYGHKVDNSIQDTPYGQLNSSSDYVTQKSQVAHSGTDSIGTRTELDSEILSRFRDRWEPTVKKIVDELGELFIGIIGGEFIL